MKNTCQNRQTVSAKILNLTNQNLAWFIGKY